MRTTLSLILSCILLAPITAAASDDAHHLAFSVGQIGVMDGIDEPWRPGLEYRAPAWTGWRLRPHAGGFHTREGSTYVYAGLQREFVLGGHWLIIPSFSAGYFDAGDEVDLGYELQFRSGFELAWRFDNNARVGLSVYHLSNASLADDNPGTETVNLVLSWPL